MTARLLHGRWLWALVVLEVLVIVATLWPNVQAFRLQPAARRELLAFTSALTLGMPRAEVLSKVSRAGRERLSAVDVDANLVLVQTPYTFGAGNWVGWLDFTDGRLSSIRIRTADGVHIKPAGSPPDVGLPPPRR